MGCRISFCYYSVWLVFWLGLSLPAQRVWHHAASPFRALFEIKQEKGGHQDMAVLEVPEAGGRKLSSGDVFCYDRDSGRQLRREFWGRSSQNRNLVLVRLESDTSSVLAYFGSGQPAPTYEMTKPLSGEIRRLSPGSFQRVDQAERLLETSSLLGRMPLDQACMVANPFTEDNLFIAVIRGNLLMEQDGFRHLFVATGGPAYLMVDDALLLDCLDVRSHWGTLRGERRAKIHLKAGLHPFRLVAFQNKPWKRFVAALGKCQMEGEKVKGVSFVGWHDVQQAARGILKRVEGKSKRSNVPHFWYRHLSYMSTEELGYLTETELGTYSGQKAEWVFEDGCRMTGKTVTRIFGQFEPVDVEVSVKRERVRGTVMFSMVAPRRRSPSNQRDFSHYSSVLAHQGVGKLRQARGIEALLRLVMYEDHHPLQVPLAKAYLSSRGAKDAVRVEAWKCLARAGSGKGADEKQLQEARNAYQKLLKLSNIDKSVKHDLAQEAVEFAIFRLGDVSLATSWLNTYGRRLRKDERIRLNVDLLLEEKKGKEARLEYAKLLEGKKLGANNRSAAVRGSFLAEKAQRAVEQGRLLEARKALDEWIAEVPVDRGNGHYSLVRARFFARMGWLKGAEAELRGVMLLDSELSNLPDVEFELATILKSQGKLEDAKLLFRRVNERYPNHPLAEKAGMLAR